MLFLLINTIDGKTIYLSEKDYTIGRKNCTILLENDQSISRQHAILRVRDDHVTLEDCKSKYHTLYKGEKIEPDIEITLKHMDLIQFGMFNNKYRFESYKFVVAASALSPDKKLTLKQSLSNCNGKYVDKWSKQCTHLTVDKLTLTIKVLQALVDEKPIVTLDYWTDYAKSNKENIPLPDINKYNRPPIAEQLLRSDFEFKVDRRRRTLFNNKLFMFPKTTTKNQMEDIIESCGGSSASWEEEPKTLLDINKSPIEHLFVKTDNDEENVSFDAIVKDLGKQKKRPIPINEIALAIVHCSCEVNCNPRFNKVSEVFGASTQKRPARDVLALETESENFMPRPVGIKSERIIPPSVEDDWTANIVEKEIHDKKAKTAGIKRPSRDQAEEIVPKKMKVEGELKQKKEAKQGKIDTFVGLEKNKTITLEDDATKNKSLPSQKRKAVEEDSNAASSIKLNPFASIKPSSHKRSKVSEEVNPFELTRTSKPSKTPPSKNDDNPFAKIKDASSRTISTVKVEEFKPKEKTSRESKLVSLRTYSPDEPSTRRSNFNISWMSKSTIKNETTKEEDPEIAKISEAFRDCVKVEVMAIYERTSASISHISFESIHGKKNFKKFRKVQPLKPQVTIISRHQLKKIAPGDVTGIEVNDNDSDDEGGYHSKIKQVVEPLGKRFVL